MFRCYGGKYYKNVTKSFAYAKKGEKMAAKLSDVLLTIEKIREIYQFPAEQTFMELGRDDLTRTPKVSLHTMDENGFDILIAKKVGVSE